MSNLVDDAKDGADKMKAGAKAAGKKMEDQNVMQALNTIRKRSKKK
jgi:hypothetical protein